MTAPAQTDVPGIAALRSDVAALGDELRAARAELAEARGELHRVRDELSPMAAQLDYLHGAGMKLAELSEQLAPMLDGLGSSPMLRALGLGGR